jgi:erythromycin esterase
LKKSTLSSALKPQYDHYPLHHPKDLDPLMDRIGDARYVLLGEATHGTHEYYTWRAEISKRLITEKGFSFIAVEGDWPDSFKINQWIKGKTNSDKGISEILNSFKRWPTWMWANWEIAALAEWLRNYNKDLPSKEMIGFYGLDVYSLWESMEIIMNYLEKEDPATALYARQAINCFEPYDEEIAYAEGIQKLNPACQNEVIKLLTEVRSKASEYDQAHEAGLNAEINALVMANAEKYYRTMASFGESSWNTRDRHMVESLNTIMDYHGPEAKVIIWEHNSHIGDARATDMADDGLVNVGQLIREQQNDKEVILVGFGSYQGSVIAGRRWNGQMEKMDMPPAIEGSVEEILHTASADNKLLIFDDFPKLKEQFGNWLGHRAIGVVYHPEREMGNYVPTKLSSRYDAFIYLDKTMALNPLHLEAEGNLPPDTYPFGF